MKAGDKARWILKAPVILKTPDSRKGGKWTYITNETEVTVMAIADGYAMVRRPRCVPVVVKMVDIKEAQ
jgi:hypothetical protein